MHDLSMLVFLGQIIRQQRQRPIISDAWSCEKGIATRHWACCARPSTMDCPRGFRMAWPRIPISRNCAAIRSSMRSWPTQASTIRERQSEEEIFVPVNVPRLSSKVDDPFSIKLIHPVRGTGYVLEAES